MNTEVNDPVSNTPNLIDLAARVVSAFVGNPNNTVSAADVPAMLSNMHSAFAGLGAPVAVAEAPVEAAVSVRKSLANPGVIISMIDGKPYKMLRRHLTTNGLTPDQYRQRYNLAADYPMVASAYSDSRRALALKIGLGTSRTRSNPAPEEAAPVAEAPKPRRRKATETKVAAETSAPKRGRPKGSTNKPKTETAKAAPKRKTAAAK